MDVLPESVTTIDCLNLDDVLLNNQYNNRVQNNNINMNELNTNNNDNINTNNDESFNQPIESLSHENCVINRTEADSKEHQPHNYFLRSTVKK